MPKAYIHNIIRAGTQESPRNDYVFDSRSEYSWYWKSADEAEILCLELKRGGVKIRSAEGVIEWIYDFTVEETSPGEFSIWCDLPFIGQ
jgi:hypothetical protein